MGLRFFVSPIAGSYHRGVSTTDQPLTFEQLADDLLHGVRLLWHFPVPSARV